jgi:hypothetical protein
MVINRFLPPPLGDKSKVYMTVLNEQEVYAIHAAVGFVLGACRDMPALHFFLARYGGTLDTLSLRLEKETEGEGPVPNP